MCGLFYYLAGKYALYPEYINIKMLSGEGEIKIMGFLSLYRKYRPQNFDDLVGQKHVVKTLKNAFKHQRIAHAYLFAGPRGTGKTSTAKVFAQALNCVQGPSIEPCGKCNMCQKIQSGQSIDVIEIDAASNRGIDEIRDLRDKVRFFPGEGSYKVYIIDEVHMLTKGAFNALLKTLEEPPENVVFILATTEPHKVLDTILSRCQRFDFTLHSFEDIKERLEYICKQEGVAYQDQALNTIVYSANGGLRDAISLLDQAISYTNAELTIEEIQQMLGKVDQKLLIQFFDYIINQQTAEALQMVNQVIDRGNSISIFIGDLIEQARQLLLVQKCGADSGILNYPIEILSELEEKGRVIDSGRLVRIIEILSELERDLSFSSQPRLLLEIGTVKIASPNIDTTLAGLVQRVASLENIIQSGSTGTINPVQGVGPENKIEPPDQPEERDVSTTTQGETTEKERALGETGIDLAQVKQVWPTVLSEIKEENIRVQAFLLEGKPTAVEGNRLLIHFPADKNFHKKGAEQEADFIGKVLSTLLGQNCRPVFILDGNRDNDLSSKKKEVVKQSTEDNREESLVEQALKVFKGEIIKVNYDLLEKKK